MISASSCSPSRILFKSFFLLSFCSLFCLFFLTKTTYSADNTEATYKNLEIFSNVLSILEKNYVEKIDPEEVIQGAVKGMLTSLDPHSSYMKPEDFKELQEETKGSFSGIGIEITIRDGILTVVSPIEGTPAFKKGLKARDMIVKIEDESTKDMTLMEAVKKLRGPKGSEVTISILREGWVDLKRITIVRNIIPLVSVKFKFIEPGFAYVRITNFQAKTTNELKKALEKLSGEEKIKGLILDLRSNPGGLLEQAVKVSDLFLKEGVIVSTRGRLSDQDMTRKAHSSGKDYTFPIIILVNEGSASAAEIVAGALQDHKRALILGAQTFGKGSVQTVIPMPSGAGLRLTTARYYTPKGVSIQAKGITPDIVVPTEIQDDSKAAKKPKKPHFLREKDLKHHIKNGGVLKKEPKESKEESKKEKDEATSAATSDEEYDLSKEEKDRELVKKDKQLHTALLMLKGLHVFETLKP